MNDSRHQLFNCDTCLFKTISCHYITEDEFEIVRRTSVQLIYNKGETIIKQGAKSQQLVFLHKGIVKFNYQNESGKNFIMTIVNGPKLLGGANLFFNETNIFSLVALEKCELCFIDSRALRNLAAHHGNYTLALCERMVEMFQSSIFNFISLAHKQVHGRIADILIYLWEQVYSKSEYDFVLSRKELAEYAACSPENVITTLSKFNKEGIITIQGRKLIINDLEKLTLISRIG